MIGKHRRRLWLEEFERRIVPSTSWQALGPVAAPAAAISFDEGSGRLAIAASAGGAAAQISITAAGGVGVTVNDQMFSSDATASSFNPAIAGASAATLRQVCFSGSASDVLTLDNVTADGGLTVSSDGTVTMAGTLNVPGNLIIDAAALNVDGRVRAATVTLDSAGLLNVESGASVTAQTAGNGGSISLAAGDFVNVGQILAQGARGGEVTVTAQDYLNAGVISAAGTNGAGGSVEVSFTQSYVDTTAALTSASGTGGAGGQVSIDGGNGGRLFSSGAFAATGTTGGSISLLGENIYLIAAMLDASGSAGSGGRVSVWSDAGTDFTGSVRATGSGGAGGFVEVSSHGTLTYSGHADAGKGGTLLLDPQNLVISAAPAGVFPQFNLIEPGGNSGYFGAQIVPLTNGNVVVTDPVGNGGAAYLFNGQRGALISALTQLAGDGVGSSATALTNGNYVVSSPYWDGGLGAVTWASGTMGVSGVASANNSLVGSTLFDHVGSAVGGNEGGVVALDNGNYVVDTPTWGSDGSSNGLGAVTWGNGTTGTSGVVSAVNSLVGGSVGDNVGCCGVTALTNGNYVVDSINWGGGKGAVTWGNGAIGTMGVVSAANSLVGSTPGGGGAGDGVGWRVTSLTNGNYVVDSSNWNGDEGAVTWGNGMTGISGVVSPDNSLVGSATVFGGEPDTVGFGGVTALENGNYVVDSYIWSDPGTGDEVGAVTWGNGTAGITGPVSTGNSLVGSNDGDWVGSGGVTALANGSYVVDSPDWGTTLSEDAGLGAVTWEDGTTAATGTVNSSNSFVGTIVGTTAYTVGGGGVTALTNGNYVIDSYDWNGNRGAVTWANGNTETTGTVSPSNSLVGSFLYDNVGGGNFGGGKGGVTALRGGNYVVVSPNWSANTGAVTWADGTKVTSGTISASNSLIGGKPGDEVGDGSSGSYGVTALANGNYVVISTSWNDDEGAATWGSGGAGEDGTISSANSLTGVSGEVVGVNTLPNGNYIVFVVNGRGAGTATWVDGANGATLDGQNTIDPQNSAAAYFPQPIGSGDSFVLSNDASAGLSGASIGTADPNLLTYAFGQDQTITVTPDFITRTLDAGTNVTLQANDDITVNSPITETPSGTAGSLTLHAGRSILLNAAIDTAGGNLTLIANDTLSDGVIDSLRDPGDAMITMASGVTLNTGAGALSIDLKDSQDKTNNGAGTVTLLGVSAASTTLSSASTLGITIDGTTAGDGTAGTYSQVNVSGPINLDGAALSVDCNTAIPAGASLVIVQASGGVSGTFNGLSEGATVLASDGSKFTISYKADSGHEVTLTAAKNGSQAPGPATQLVIHTQPSATSTAGQPFANEPVIYEEDQFGNLETSDNSTVVTVSLASGAGPLQGTTTAVVSGGVARFTTLADNKSEAISLKFSSGNLTNASSNQITVRPATPSELVIQTQPSSTATAGQPFANPPVVYEEDQYGNLEASDNSTVVTVSLASGAGPLKGTTTAVVSGGAATFTNLADDLAETIALEFTSGRLTPVTSNTTIVSAAVATKLVITAQPPATVNSGSAFGFRVAAEDPFGNVDLTFSQPVSVALAANPGGATLKGTLTVTGGMGVATFSGLSLNKPGKGYKSLVTSNSLTPATTNAFNVTQTTLVPPKAFNDAYAVTENKKLSIRSPGVLANDQAGNAGALTAVLVSKPKHGTLTFKPNGSFVYAPNRNFKGTDRFTYKDTAMGGKLLSNVATVALTASASATKAISLASTGQAPARVDLARVEESRPRRQPSAAGLQPTPVEQLFLERLNDARANPAAYGASIGLNLSGVAPAAPLAFNTRLIQAAYLHSLDMFTRHYFDHVTPNGITPPQRMLAAGVRPVTWGESIAEGWPGVASALQELIVDTGVPDLSHRRMLLEVDAVFKPQNQVGIGIYATGPDDPYLYIPGYGVPGSDPREIGASYFYTIDTAATRPHQTVLTGAVFRNSDGTGKYEIGEGLAGVTITVSGIGSVQDFNSGGFTVPLRHPGTYQVTAHGGDLPAPITRTVHVGASNVRVEFIVP
jgi:uncharacterized protein YkwD